MAIRTDTPDAASTAIVLLVEDSGFCESFPAILNATSIANAKHDVHVIDGAGWTKLYLLYNKLVDNGIDAARIIPLLDADTLGQNPPRSTIHQNPQIFRFQVDFEFEFATGDCMLLDHALLFLHSDLFGEYGNVKALGIWSQIVQQALIDTLNQGGTTLDNVKIGICQHRGKKEGLEIHKVALSKVLLELCLETGAMPQEIDRLLLIIEALANDKPRPTTLSNPSVRRPLWESSYAALLPMPASSLTGKILFNSDNGELKCIYLSDGSKITIITNAENLWFNAWLPDGRLAATRGNSEGVIIASAENVADQTLLSHGVREHFLCWHQRERRILLASAHTGKTFSVSEDNRSWHPIPTPDYGIAANHCVNNRGLLAWAAYEGSGYKTIYVRPLDGGDDKRISVPDVLDARHSLAWSHNGNELAFVNAEDGTDRRSICIWNRKENRTRFILPWIGKPLRIAWSPDDQYIVFQLDCSNDSRESEGLFLVQAQSGPQTRSKILHLSSEGGHLLYDAWHS